MTMAAATMTLLMLKMVLVCQHRFIKHTRAPDFYNGGLPGEVKKILPVGAQQILRG